VFLSTGALDAAQKMANHVRSGIPLKSRLQLEFFDARHLVEARNGFLWSLSESDGMAISSEFRILDALKAGDHG